MNPGNRIRVLYSFPHKIGAGRICHIAWQQVAGLMAAGVEVQVHPGVLHRAWPDPVSVQPTLARGRFRIPYRLLGTLRACELHDALVARRLEDMAGRVDIVHTWPLAARRTLECAKRLGISTVLERPNAHTRMAFEAVQRECERLNLKLPKGYEHAYDAAVLEREEEEYRLADALLCPSDFVTRTFLDHGFAREHLVRHCYGFDETRFYPITAPRNPRRGLIMLFAGLCAVRKGVHLALEAWVHSPASENGCFLIAGDFLPAYAEKLRPLLAHPSVRVLGQRDDVPQLMRWSDMLVLPSLEEGYGLVVAEAMGSGCVPLVSEACTEVCRHMESGLRHRIGDVRALAGHMAMLHEDRALLERLRNGALRAAPELTWMAAGRRLRDVYANVIASHAPVAHA
jgi:glycosyltransferase involved in cell wall biosynthesis